MAYASKSGRAWASAFRPEAQGVCDRCGFRYLLSRMQWQFDYLGNRLQNTRLIVCDRCLDVPHVMTVPVVVPPDPVPVRNPRPDDYALSLSNQTTLFDQNLEIITDSNGAPIQGTSSGQINVPPYPFVGFTMLRSPDGGTVEQIAVRDDAYAVTTPSQPQVQVADTYGNPVFSTTPPTAAPATAYNNLNRYNLAPGQVPSQNAWPVVFDVED